MSKRFYTGAEVAEFGADGTPWPRMYVASLSNIGRGSFNATSLQDARRMGELSGLSNRRIGRDIARAVARPKHAKTLTPQRISPMHQGEHSV